MRGGELNALSTSPSIVPVPSILPRSSPWRPAAVPRDADRFPDVICKKPFMVEGALPVGCGQCLPCRVSKQRMWAHRMYLESLMHDTSCFLTLTYKPEELPVDGSLDPAHPRDFLKRVRAHIAPQKLRFVLAGEYGDKGQRPHYHLMMFGMSMLDLGLFESKWPLGFVYAGDCNIKTCMYVSKYTLKRMTEDTDWRLDGRHPEFARRSLKPGIGALAMAVICEKLQTRWGQELLRETGDVPRQLKLGKQTLVLGRYLRQKLRQEIGMTDDDIEAVRDSWVEEKLTEMQPLRLAASKTVQAPSQLLVAQNQGRIWSIEARAKIRRTKL